MNARLDDWDLLGKQWRAVAVAEPLPLELLRHTVRRRQREMFLLRTGEIAFTTVVLAFTFDRLVRSDFNRVTLLWAAMVVLWTAVVWSFSIWNRRGSWQPLGETTRDYLTLSRQRVVAGGRTVRFVRVTLVLYGAGYGTWFLTRLRAGIDVEERTIWIFAAAFCSAMYGWSAWYTRRLSHDLMRIESIERSLAFSEAA